MEYNDNYPSCRATYATLRILRDDLDPDAVSSVLSIVPSDGHRMAIGRAIHGAPGL